MSDPRWRRIGAVADLKATPLRQLEIESVPVALSYADGKFGAILGTCLHDGGPLGEGTLERDCVVCPWHGWMFHRLTGEVPTDTSAAVPHFRLKEEGGALFIDLEPVGVSTPSAKPAHPLARDIRREPGPLRVAGISTTSMNRQHPRFSTSEHLLDIALADARETHGAEVRFIRLNDLNFRPCEGYYSKGAETCTWPCTITQQDPADELVAVYEALVFWADVVLVATPIRWGAPASLYFKMIERMNCIQNQITVANRVLIRNKVAAFIITGGQDNIQAVAGSMMMFFGELGFQFPQFPFIAHSRGWTAEDMETNVAVVRDSAELRDGARALVGRCVAMADRLINADEQVASTERGGRKAHPVDAPPGGAPDAASPERIDDSDRHGESGKPSGKEDDMSTTDNLKAAFAGESQANRKYLAFAQKAQAEGLPQIARLFRATAEAETVHAHNHLRVLGGVKTTLENLRAAIAGEAEEFTSMYPGFIAEAEKEGNKGALMSFKGAMAVEETHHGLYRQALAALEAGKDMPAAPIHVCGVCGHTVTGDAPDKCPVCGAPKARFTATA